MATVNNPLAHDIGGNDFNAAGFRLDHMLVAGEIRLRLMDSFTLRTSGSVPLIQDLAGTGSDTARSRAYDLVGWGLSMTSMAAENTQITPSTIEAETDDIAIGRFGIGYNQTYTDQILKTTGEIDTLKLADFTMESYEAAWMDSLATTGESFTQDSGTPGADLTVDDLLDVVFSFDLLEGDLGVLWSMLHGQQIRDQKVGFRSEPAYQFPDISQEILRTKGGPGFEGERFGINLYKSSRVVAAGGNRHGFVWGVGAIGWILGSTDGVNPRDEDQTIRVDDMALIIELTGTPDSALSSIFGNAFFGTGIIDDERGRGLVTDQ